ncbi:hypothetical protein GR925_19330 [Streptomyces sp. HUCO-GS316]|uniref:hypothetical protein n=1 Tax=Streptomyces sp. HUCO-GS316 TaxID=2692198 RepID=UPI00136D031C|nr:hypothetical protein [Streptomyces sp. HUCO-GS316]MXM65546.1 hypothetical protein [Streptomyces sp. HUCO-GS316]
MADVDLTAGASAENAKNYGFLGDPHEFMWRARLGASGEANTLRWLGDWLRTSVLTQEIWDRLPARPSTVLVRLNADGPEREILGYPLVLAADKTGSLAERKLVFVHDVARARSHGDEEARRARADAPLHLVGVFNRTKAGEPLDLHAEQSQVFGKVRHIAAVGSGRDITRRTLSYHVTHDQLKAHLQSAKRPDRQGDPGQWQMILHLADRGAPGSWSAVDDSRPAAVPGAKSPLSASELVDMLQTGDNDQRLRLAVITTRPAKSPSLADQLEMFRIPSHLATEPSKAVSPEPDVDGLALDLARRLGCAVLAFRHGIADQAAVAVMVKVYEHLLAHRLPLPRAVGVAIAECKAQKLLTDLDVVAPVIYGADACGLVVDPPSLPTPDEPTQQQPPPSLIGHHDPMWTASAIFARLGDTQANGAVLHGMAGVGKTTCADELIGQYAHCYREVVRYPLPDRPMDDSPSAALKGFVAALLKLPALQQAFEKRRERIPAPSELEEFLANADAFERLCEDIDERLTTSDTAYVLVCLSDVGNLIVQRPQDLRTLSSNGHGPSAQSPWRDEQWERLINAMTAHHARGFRLLITSPTPLHLDQRRLPDVPVPLLAPAEAFLYAQSLPGLAGVIADAARDVSGEDGRRIVHHVLARAEGHPGLLRFANDVAAKPDGRRRLRRLAMADSHELGRDSSERIPEAWQKIEKWAEGVLNCIPRGDPRHLLLLVLSELSARHRVLPPDDDSVPGLLAEVWAGLRVHRHRLWGGARDPEPLPKEAQPAIGEREELRELLDALGRACLIDCLELPEGKHIRIRMQPAVGEAVRRHHATWLDGDGSLRADVDRIAIRHTAGRVEDALRHRTHGRTADVQRLIPEAMPYLERAGAWEAWLPLVAIRMTRSRGGRRGLDGMVRKLERVTADIRDKGSDQYKMAERLGRVFKALGEGDRPGLSALLGNGPSDAVVDNSPLAMAMGVGILSGLRDTGRLAVAREVGNDYLRFVAAGTRATLVASAVEVELLRVMVDQGELTEAQGRIELAFEAIADVRFRDAVHTDWADGEILRKKLFTIRRDSHVLLAQAVKDDAARARHLELARADHERLGQYLALEGPDEIEEHLHAVEGCLLGVDRRLEGTQHDLELYDRQLRDCPREAERSGDVVVQAMTDSARARIKRELARRAPDRGGEWVGHGAMMQAREYELKALRLLYAQGTPMDIGACHRRIGDDQLACQHERLRNSTPVHQMYAALLGRLTGAHVLKERPSDREAWRRFRSQGTALPDSVQELCERIRADVFTEGREQGSGAMDPENVLRKLVDDDSELTEAFRGMSADS